MLFCFVFLFINYQHREDTDILLKKIVILMEEMGQLIPINQYDFL